SIPSCQTRKSRYDSNPIAQSSLRVGRTTHLPDPTPYTLLPTPSLRFEFGVDHVLIRLMRRAARLVAVACVLSLLRVLRLLRRGAASLARGLLVEQLGERIRLRPELLRLAL